MRSKEEILQDKVDPHCFLKSQCLECVYEAMQEYAQQEAIEFKEWHDSNLEGDTWQQYDGNDRWVDTRTNKVITTEELYQNFKQQKTINK